MNSKIKLITIDIDETLVDDQKNIPQANIDAIKAAKQAGVHVALCSGRPLSGVLPYLKQLGLTGADDYSIVLNGAVCVNVGTNQIVSQNPLTTAQYEKILNLTNQLGINAHGMLVNSKMFSPDNHVGYYTALDAYFTHCDILANYDALATPIDVAELMWADDPEKIAACYHQIPQAIFDEFYVVNTAPHFVEFQSKTATKGSGLLNLAEYLGIDKRQTMAIGDHNNDEPMIRQAQVGVAMGNAIEPIKNIADFITTTNNEAGVANAINHFVLNQ